MKKLLVITAVILGTACLVAGSAFALEAPHDNYADGGSPINCGNCHYSGATPSWAANATGVGDNTYYNAMCESCHSGAMPQMGNHSSYSLTSTYGDWRVECRNCHNPHEQMQASASGYDQLYPAGSYVFTATVTAIDPGVDENGSPNPGVTTITVDTPMTADYSGYIAVPNSDRAPGFRYKVVNGASTVGTDKIAIGTGQYTPYMNYYLFTNDTLALVYGKYIRSTVVTPGGESKAVKFFTPQAGPATPHNFADGDTTYDGICEVCHTQTTEHRNDGSVSKHNVDKACTSCHIHEESFKGGCKDCHGVPPLNDSTYGNDGLIALDRNSATKQSGGTLAGAHASHVQTVGLSCENCHQGGMLAGPNPSDPATDIDNLNLGFSIGGTPIGGSYDGQAAVDAVYPYQGYAGPPATNVTLGGNMECSNVYCHGSGQGPTAGDATPVYQTPVWTGSVACGDCHKTTTGTTLGRIDTGSHTAHLTSGVSIQCGDCHTGAGNGTVYNSGNHVNQVINVAAGYDAGGSPGNGYGQCATQACHGGDGTTPNSPQWGTNFVGTDSCTRCHGTPTAAPASQDKWAPPSDTAGDTAASDAQVGAHQAHLLGPSNYADPVACTECHVVPSAVQDAGHIQDGTPGSAEVTFAGAVKAGLNGAAPAYDGTNCNNTYCHGAAMPKGTSEGADMSPAWADDTYLTGVNTNDCAQCHGYAPAAIASHAGVQPDQCSGCHADVNAAGDGFATVSEHIDGVLQVSGCTGCHGQSTVSGWPSDATELVSPATGGGGVGGHAGHITRFGDVAGTCDLCHNGHNMPSLDNTITISFSGLGAGGSYDGVASLNSPYNYSAGVGSGGTLECSNVYCHGSTIGGTNPAWNGSVACGDCHKATAADPPTLGSHQRHAGNAAGQLNQACTNCHGAGAGGATHMDGDVTWDVTAIGGTYSGAASGATGAVAPSGTYATCNNVYCHSDVQANGGNGGPTAYAAPTWGAASVACDSCHGGAAQTTGEPATGSHATHATSFGYNCDTCHNGGGDETALHADGSINMSGIAGGTYGEGGTPAPNNGGYGSCATSQCHGSASPTWGAGSSSDCSLCHGMAANPADGRDTNGDTAATDAQVGAHVVHLTAPGGITTAVSCDECHVDPSATAGTYQQKVNTAGHIDSALPAELNFGGRAVLNGSPAAYAAGTCSGVYCHGDNLPAGTSDGSDTTPNWTNTGLLSNAAGNASTDCVVCHAAPPDPVAIPSHSGKTLNDCNTCHKNVTYNGGTDTATFATLAQHINGSVEVDGCNACHGTSGPTGAPLVAGDEVSPATGGVGVGAHPRHVTDAGFTNCNLCHSGNGMPALNDVITVAFSGAAAGGTYDEGPALNAPYSYGGDIVGNGGGGTNFQCSNVYCHGSTIGGTAPVWNGTVACGDCHNATAGTPPTLGSHPQHAGNGAGQNNQACTDCHGAAGAGNLGHMDQVVAWDVSALGGSATYSGLASGTSGAQAPSGTYGDCANVYCHGDTLTQGVNTTPTWGGVVACGDCHGAVAATPGTLGSHPQHAGNGVGQNNQACTDCHGASAGGTGHVNKDVSWDVTALGGSATYSGAATGSTGGLAPSAGYGNCSNTYCHGDTLTQGVNTTPTWGGTVSCGDCHGAAGATPGTLGSHAQHAGNGVGQNNQACTDCHGASAGGSGHVNKDVSWDVTALGASVTYSGSATGSTGALAPSAGYGNCANTYCHGSGTPQWGGTVNCGDCHDVNNNLEGRHGTHYATATNANSGDRTTAANNSVAGNYEFSCAVCHNGASHAGGAVGGGQTAEIAFDGTVAGGGSYAAGSGNTGGAGDFDWTSGGCSSTYCHSDAAGGAPNTAVNWGMGAGSLDCAGCHDYDAAATPNTMASGSHTAHINDGTVMGNQGCQVCHNATTTDGTTITDKSVHVNGTKDVALASGGGSYSAGNCSTNYCHSDGQGGSPLVDAQWGVTNADCVTCHGGATAGTTLSGAHESHLVNAGATIGRNLTCDQCHADTASDNTTISTPANHVDGTKTIKVAIDGTTCNNIQCHSNGNLDGTLVYNNPVFATATLGCTDCHGDGATKAYPSYADGGAGTGASNSHNAHVGTSGLTCKECHAATSNDGTAIDGTTPANHVNQTVDISFDQGGSIDASEQCSNTYCHGTGASPAWGTAGPLSCDTCHGASNAMPGRHGSHYATATVATDRTAANNSSAGAYIFNCGVCHDGTAHAGGTVSGNQAAEVIFNAAIAGASATHTAGALAGNDNGFNYTNATCSSTYCHSDGLGGAPNNTTFAWNDAAGAFNCESCHNYDAAATNKMATGSHTPHMNDGSVMTNKGCQECHNGTTTDGSTIADKSLHVNGAKNVALAAAWGGTFAAGDCSNVYCHSDGKATAAYATVTWGSGTADCVFCHGGAGGSNGGAGTALSASHTVHTDGAGFNYDCNNCHSATATDSSTIGTPANHVNKSRDVAVTVANGGTGTIGGDFATGSCATTNCHGSASPDWTAGATTGDCSACHGMARGGAARDTNGDTAATDQQVGAHAAHLNGPSGLGSAVTCATCHNDPDATVGGYEAKVNTAGHIDSALPAEVSLTGGRATGNGLYPSPTYTSPNCATWCHGAGMNTAQPAPTWNDPTYLPATPGKDATTCTKCHEAPPGSSANYDHVTAGLTLASDCSGCHGHNGFGGTHIDGTLDASGGSCDACHAYPPAIGDGKAYVNVEGAAPGVEEGKGGNTVNSDVHMRHVTTIRNEYIAAGADPGALDAANDAFGDAKTTKLCGTCHNMDAGQHDMGGSDTTANGNGTRHIDFSGVGDATRYQFGPTAPVYNGVPGTSSNTNLKSCSNISCHFGETPGWQDPATAGN